MSVTEYEMYLWTVVVVLVTKLCPTLVTPWTVAHQAPLSMGFPRQEYWSGLPFPSPKNLPHPEIEPASPALQADSLPLATRETLTDCGWHYFVCVCVGYKLPLLILHFPSTLLTKATSVKNVSHTVVSNSGIPWTVACQAPLSMEFSRQEYWSEYQFPSPGYFPNPGIEPRSPALQVDSLPSEPPGKQSHKEPPKENISRSSFPRMCQGFKKKKKRP